MKNLLLGSVAGIAMVGTAAAADLPVKAKAAEYVKICSTYGAGFYYIPGTDTCLKVGGFVQTDYYWQDYSDIPEVDYEDTYFKARGTVRLDARTQTEYGTLRSFIDLRGTYGNGGDQGDGYFGQSQTFTVDKAYIQFAGFTFGKVQSFFDFYADNNIWGFDSPAITADANTIAAAYTADFGNGFTATISIEDDSNRANGVYDTGPYSSFDLGTDIPAIVGALRYEAEWGALAFSAAARELDTDGSPLWSGVAANLSDDWGYALLAGVMFNLPALGEGDTLYVEGAWGKGAVGYTGASGGLVPQGRDVYYDVLSDSFNASDSWSVAAELTHYFTPEVFTVLYGGYAELDAKNGAINGVGASVDDVLFYDFYGAGYNTYTLGASLNWSPVKNLLFVAQYSYSKYDYDNYTVYDHTYDDLVRFSGGSEDAQQVILSVRRTF